MAMHERHKKEMKVREGKPRGGHGKSMESIWQGKTLSGKHKG